MCKNRLLFYFIFIIFLISNLSACNQQENFKIEATETTSNQTQKSLATISPTQSSNIKMIANRSVIFLHGYSGTKNSLGKMITRLSKGYNDTHKSLIITVDYQGRISYTGTLEQDKINLIQLLFSNNKASIYQQAQWLKSTCLELKKMAVNELDIVAHSMGGETVTYYLENFYSQVNIPKINKFIPIATPFTWNFGGPDDFKVSLDNLKRGNIFYQNKSKLPAYLNIMAIVGVVKSAENGDNTVPLISSTFGKYIFDQCNYTEQIINGPSAKHSLLHENKEVDDLVADYLW